MLMLMPWLHLRDTHENNQTTISEDRAPSWADAFESALVSAFPQADSHTASYSSPPSPRLFLQPFFWRDTHVVFYSFSLFCIILHCKLLTWWCSFMVLYTHCNMCVCIYLEYVCLLIAKRNASLSWRPHFSWGMVSNNLKIHMLHALRIESGMATKPHTKKNMVWDTKYYRWSSHLRS